MVSAENLLNYPDWKITFTVHTDASDRHLGGFISQNKKHIDLFLIKVRKPQKNYTAIDN